MKINELYKLCDNDSRMIGAIQELEQLRKSEIKPAKNLMNNTVIQQLFHMQSSFDEIIEEIDRDFVNNKSLAKKVIKLQKSCQTFLEGSLQLSKTEISNYIQEINANDAMFSP